MVRRIRHPGAKAKSTGQRDGCRYFKAPTAPVATAKSNIQTFPVLPALHIPHSTFNLSEPLLSLLRIPTAAIQSPPSTYIRLSSLPVYSETFGQPLVLCCYLSCYLMILFFANPCDLITYLVIKTAGYLP